MSPAAALIILGVLGGVLLVVAGFLLFGRRRSPDEKERARRIFLSARGRVSEAEITDVQGELVGYSYQVGGVTYHVVQDLAPFRHLMPRDPSLLLGPALIRYSRANPANSIILSEEWSGIRMARPDAMKQKGA
ncbi:MAG: hypothetical protein IT167_13870 [Bryobacterales bacterium]|nr:hypothetical protein [Bryobacterales bacterium]